MMMKNNGSKNALIWRIYGVVFLVILAGILLVKSGPETSYRFAEEKIATISKGWTSVNDGKIYNLPSVIPGEVGKPFALTRILDKPFEREQYICVRGSLQRVRVLLDDQVLYDNVQIQKGLFHAPKLSIWNMIKIPENAAGKKLTLEYTTDIKSLTGRFANVYYGSESEIINYLGRAYGHTLPLVGAMFIFGLIMFILPMIFRHYKQIELIFLGLFAMTISLWFFSESLLLQFFTGNTWILGGSGCILQSIAPIPLILYIRMTIVEKTKKIFSFMTYVLAINTLLIVGLQLFGVMELFESLIITHVVFGGVATLTIISFSLEIIKNHNTKASRFIKALLPFIFFVGVEILDFYTQSFHKSTHFTKIGLLFFLAVQSFDSIGQMIALVKKSYQAELYEKLAYEDRLTGSGNRMAFDHAIERYFNKEKPNDKWRLTIFDFNKLKLINDQYGHTAGDEALIIGYLSIKEAFNTGQCFRIGGDEFACICNDCDEETYEGHLKLLKKLLEKESEALPYTLGVSVGSAIVDYTRDKDYKELMHRADMKMYENKYIA